MAAAEAAEDAGTEGALTALANAYHKLLTDRTLLLMQMHAYAACGDEEIREVMRDELLRLVSFVQSASGAPDKAVREWLAHDMPMNVVTAVDLSAVDEDWARMMCPITEGLTKK